jgi:hypothetical protein
MKWTEHFTGEETEAQRGKLTLPPVEGGQGRMWFSKVVPMRVVSGEHTGPFPISSITSRRMCQHQQLSANMSSHVNMSNMQPGAGGSRL